MELNEQKILLDGQIDLSRLLNPIIMRWHYGLLIVFASTTLFFGFSYLVQEKFEASALLLPSKASEEGADSLTQRYGGIASIAGLSIPSDDNVSETDITLAVLGSRSFINSVIEKNKFAPYLLASSYYSKQEGLIFDISLYDVTNEKWLENDEFPVPPSRELLFDTFSEDLTIAKDADTGLIGINFRHLSPGFSSRVIEVLVEELNRSRRAQEIEETNSAVKYLREKIDDNAIAELDQVFYELIQSQVQKRMLAEVKSDYALKYLDPPWVSEKPVSPSRLIFSGIGFIFGLFLFAVFVVNLHSKRAD